MDERPYVPSDRWMTDEEAARLSEWHARFQRRETVKGMVALLVGVIVVGLGILKSPEQTRPREDVAKSPQELAAEVRASREEYSAAVQRLEISVESRKELEDLLTLQARYDELQALASGQEEIARIHRAILSERTLLDRGADFMLGVFASLLAALVYDRVSSRARKPASEG